jgi:ferredoxin-NADP reductase
MKSHIVKVLETQRLTHNVKRFVIQKPAGFIFIPGQSTEVSINKPGFEDELRPFSFTCCNTDDYLEFIIKIHTGRDGVTEKLGGIEAGDELIIHEVFGSIQYKGPGVFIARGCGITPFLAILRQLKLNNALRHNILLFANHFDQDIILKDELEEMLGDRCQHILDHIPRNELDSGRINSMLLEAYWDPISHYYICGPDGFVTQMVADLIDIGVEEERIVIESQKSPAITISDQSNHADFVESSTNANTEALTVTNI